MEFNKFNREIFEALEILKPLVTSKVSMYSIDDLYSHPPFIRFRFKGVQKSDSIYDKIKVAVERFKGNIEWKLISDPNKENYIITPAIFVKYAVSENFYKKDFYILVFGNSFYKDIIDKSIKDIPNLANSIASISN